MSWQDVTAIYQASTVLMAVVCLLAVMLDRSAVDVAGAAMVVFVFTVMSRMISREMDPPWSTAHMPMQDLICVAVAWWGHRRSPRWWTFALAMAFTVQLGGHVAYWGSFAATGAVTWIQTTIYLWVINGLFLAELAILTAAGGGHVAGYVRARLPVFHRGTAVSGLHGKVGP